MCVSNDVDPIADYAAYVHPSPERIALRRAGLAPFDGWNERAFMILCAWRGFPRRYLDLGSGTGAMVNMARRMGIEAYGFDVIADGPGKEGWLKVYDLTQPLYIYAGEGEEWGYGDMNIHQGEVGVMTFDLITCIETAEHLPESAADTLCDTISRHIAHGGMLVFSAAQPGQGGDHHVNLQSARYWQAKLYERGICWREDYTLQLSHLWAWTAGPMHHLAANVQVFDYF